MYNPYQYYYINDKNWQRKELFYPYASKVTQFKRALQLQVTCQKTPAVTDTSYCFKILTVTVTSYSIFTELQVTILVTIEKG